MATSVVILLLLYLIVFQQWHWLFPAWHYSQTLWGKEVTGMPIMVIASILGTVGSLGLLTLFRGRNYPWDPYEESDVRVRLLWEVGWLIGASLVLGSLYALGWWGP